MKLKAKEVFFNRKLEFKNRLLDVVANCFGHFLNFLQSVDCTRKQCNYEDRRATKESCQKCKDLEKCYKTTVRIGQGFEFTRSTIYRLFSSYLNSARVAGKDGTNLK